MTRRTVSNPLALAVLACLHERPMHPYEMATTMRTRRNDQSIKLNYGSLYTVVETLQRHELIEAHEVEREGRRPERTVYRITDAGEHELLDWLSELLSTPEKEYTRYGAGLSFLPVLSPAEAVRLLELRGERLEMELAARRSARTLIEEHGIPGIVVVEFDYETALLEAEQAWTRRLVADIGSRAIDGIELWERFIGGAPPPEPGSTPPATADAAPTPVEAPSRRPRRQPAAATRARHQKGRST